MTYTLDTQPLIDGAKYFNVRINEEQINALVRYCQLVLGMNEKMNLTRVPADEFMTLHLVDSLSIARVVDLGCYNRLLDAGTGAGFPGVPLAILFPHLQVTLVDATRKKLAFIESACAEIGVKNIQVVHSRLEDLCKTPSFRGACELVTARALANLSALASLILPLLTKGGTLVAYKGPSAQEELTAASDVVTKFGGKVSQIEEFSLPNSGTTRTLIVIEKGAAKKSA
jgi:16S rRNA (guanine527-N7)-methyltransferase